MIRQNDRSLIRVKKREGIQYKKYWIPVFFEEKSWWGVGNDMAKYT